jgi:hypothetical protein
MKTILIFVASLLFSFIILAQDRFVVPPDLLNRYNSNMSTSQFQGGSYMVVSDAWRFGTYAVFECRSLNWGCSTDNAGHLENEIPSEIRTLFQPACRAHDYCYAAPWSKVSEYHMKPGMFRNFSAQTLCDDNFFQDMSKICRQIHPSAACT